MSDNDAENRPLAPQEETASEGKKAAKSSSEATEQAAAAAAGKADADSRMVDGSTDAPSPVPPAQPAPSAGTGRTGTPVRNTAASERLESSSRAASAHPEPAYALPAEAPLNGAPVRQYINSKITGPLLEGMKMIAVEQPRDPLRVLGQFLLKKSQELEGTK